MVRKLEKVPPKNGPHRRNENWAGIPFDYRESTLAKGGKKNGENGLDLPTEDRTNIRIYKKYKG